jgi:outer membrane receptor protein involved in Fe transport
VLGAQGDDHYFEEYDDGPSLTPGGSDHGLVVGAAGTRAWTGQLRLWSGDWKLQAYTNGRDHRYPTGAFGTLIGDEEAAVTDLRSYLELEQEGAELGPGLLQGRVWLDHYSFRGGYPYPGDYLLLDAWDGLWTGLEPRYRLALGGQGSLTLGLEGRAYVLAHLKSTDPSVVNEQEPTRQTLGAYAQAELRPADWFIGTLGARYDWTSLEEAGGAFNPRAALVFLAGEDDVIKAMGGTAFRAPSPYEWYYNDGGLTQVPPLSLAPERIATLELEHSHRFSEVITLTSAAWFNRISSLVDTELTGEVGEEGQIFRYANSEVPVRSAGSEVELRRDWAGGWMAAAQVSAQYTALEGEDQAFTNSPWLLSGFKVAAPLGAAGGLLASRLRVESPRATIAEQQTPWSAIWDLVWSGRISDSTVTASAGVYNLLDWRVEHPGGQDLRQDSIQQPGRTLGLSMTWTAPGAP